MDYKNNSNKAKQERKPLKSIVNGKRKKKGLVMNYIHSMLPNDGQSLKQMVVMDIVLPMVKSGLMDMIDTFLPGSASGSRRKKSSGSRVSYRGFYEDDRKESSRKRVSGMVFEDVECDSRSEAEELLETLEDIVDKYDVVTVADMYDLAGIPTKHTDNKYGWTNLKNADVRRDGDVYILKMPRASTID